MQGRDEYYASLFPMYQKGELPLIWAIVVATILALISAIGIALNSAVVYVTVKAR